MHTCVSQPSRPVTSSVKKMRTTPVTASCPLVRTPPRSRRVQGRRDCHLRENAAQYLQAPPGRFTSGFPLRAKRLSATNKNKAIKYEEGRVARHPKTLPIICFFLAKAPLPYFLTIPDYCGSRRHDEKRAYELCSFSRVQGFGQWLLSERRIFLSSFTL